MSLAALVTEHLPATFTYPGLSEDDFAAICAEFPDSTIEYDPDGTVIIMPPTDPNTSTRVILVTTRLTLWAIEDGRGIVSGPDGGFRSASGARRSPDAAWRDSSRWQIAEKTGASFPVFAPEFVIELRSPDDKLGLLREKMQEYIDNGVLLAWLIDPRSHEVEIYRPGRAPEVLSNPATVAGEGPVAGFVLDLAGIL